MAHIFWLDKKKEYRKEKTAVIDCGDDWPNNDNIYIIFVLMIIFVVFRMNKFDCELKESACNDVDDASVRVRACIDKWALLSFWPSSSSLRCWNNANVINGRFFYYYYSAAKMSDREKKSAGFELIFLANRINYCVFYLLSWLWEVKERSTARARANICTTIDQ